MTDQYEAESNGLVIQHRYLTAALGGLLPKDIPPFEVHTVLDVGCGPGGWALRQRVEHDSGRAAVRHRAAV